MSRIPLAALWWVLAIEINALLLVASTLVSTTTTMLPIGSPDLHIAFFTETPRLDINMHEPDRVGIEPILPSFDEEEFELPLLVEPSTMGG